MKNFLKNNWFKLTIIIIALGYIIIFFLGFCLKAREYNFEVYKDSIRWCVDISDGRDPSLSICQKSIDRYYFNRNFFVNNKSQKLFEREKAFWNCYSVEWNKNHNSEEASKYCSTKADKTIK